MGPQKYSPEVLLLPTSSFYESYTFPSSPFKSGLKIILRKFPLKRVEGFGYLANICQQGAALACPGGCGHISQTAHLGTEVSQCCSTLPSADTQHQRWCTHVPWFSECLFSPAAPDRYWPHSDSQPGGLKETMRDILEDLPCFCTMCTASSNPYEIMTSETT